jgi:hypothetical protein
MDRIASTMPGTWEAIGAAIAPSQNIQIRWTDTLNAAEAGTLSAGLRWIDIRRAAQC